MMQARPAAKLPANSPPALAAPGREAAALSATGRGRIPWR